MNNRIFSIIGVSLIVITAVSAQLSELEVKQRLDLIHSGKLEHVKTEVSEMLKQSPNDPAVRYLEAYVLNNGDQAVKKYQAIVDNFPQSDWADDALYKVYQYYYAVGMYKTADAKLNQLNQQYPNSIFAKTEVKPSEIGIQKPETTDAPGQTTEQRPEQPVIQLPEQSDGPFAVQVGVYSQASKAKEQAANFSASVGRTAIVFTKNSGGRTVYAVAFEGFSDEQSAKVFGAELKSRFGLDWFVVKR